MSTPNVPADPSSSADSPSPIMQAIQQLLEERKHIESFAQESYARLNELQSIRAEYASEPWQVEQLRADLAERGLGANSSAAAGAGTRFAQ